MRLQQSAHIQDDLESMSSNITRKLFSHLRDSACQFMAFKPSALPRKSALPNPTFAPSPRRAFSWSRPRAQQSFPKRSVSKSFASCGILFLYINPAATATASTIASCTATVEKSLYTATTIPRKSLTSLAQQAWRREIHSSTRRRARGTARRNKSSASSDQNIRKQPQNGSNALKATPLVKKTENLVPDTKSTSYLHLPHMHRPTKEELLAAATGFWSRLKVRFKWFSIRSVRPWNIDDWSAFVSWFVLGNIVWILVGTTTFFSLVIFSINTVVAQGTS